MLLIRVFCCASRNSNHNYPLFFKRARVSRRNVFTRSRFESCHDTGCFGRKVASVTNCSRALPPLSLSSLIVHVIRRSVSLRMCLCMRLLCWSVVCFVRTLNPGQNLQQGVPNLGHTYPWGSFFLSEGVYLWFSLILNILFLVALRQKKRSLPLWFWKCKSSVKSSVDFCYFTQPFLP